MRWRTLLLATLLVSGGLSLQTQRADSAPPPKTSGPPQPSLLMDVNPADPSGSAPQSLTAVGSAVYFQADDGVHGLELWRSDGAGKGSTKLVKDFYPGNKSAFSPSDPQPMVAVGETLFFVADDGVHGAELWKSDGTSEGTVLVKDIRSGTFGSLIRQMTASSGVLFFTAVDDFHGWELWKSDGTTSGTALVKDIRPGSAWSSHTGLTDWSGTLFFSTDDGVSGRELWRSDGTESGTVLVKDLNPGTNGSGPSSMTVSSGTLFFSASAPAPDGRTVGTELWKTDGTAPGTTLVTDIQTGSAGSSPTQLADVAGTLFFSAADATHGRELWKSDGSSEGTVLVKNIRADINFPRGSSPLQLTNVAGTLFFVATDDVHGQELWRSNGTAGGTEMILDIRESGATFEGGRSFAVVGTTLFFGADDGMNGKELWRSDGTAVGTRMVMNINPTSCSYCDDEMSSYVDRLVRAGQRIFFSANDGVSGRELWRSDGTATGTALVKNIRLATNASSNPVHLATLGGASIFSANDGKHGHELWKTDGTPSGTAFIKDIYPGPRSSGPIPMATVGNVLYFAADDEIHGRELWKTDGTTTGTVLVKDIGPEAEDSLSDSALWSTAIGNMVYFPADDGESGRELWKTDGTAAGTSMVLDINPSADSNPSYLTGFEGSLYFSADDGVHGRELWRTDLTVPVSATLSDINITPTGAFASVETGIYPNIDPGIGLGDPVTIDPQVDPGNIDPQIDPGTVDPENVGVDANAYTDGSNAQSLQVVGSRLLFLADDSLHGMELWKVERMADGSDAVNLVKDINQGSNGHGGGVCCGSVEVDGLNLLVEFGSFSFSIGDADLDFLTPIDERVFFSANDGFHGQELWVSDGTLEGTVLVKDVDPSTSCADSDCTITFPNSSSPSELTEVNGVLYFRARDSEHGHELWKSDGTESGTGLVRDIKPGPNSSWPDDLTSANGRLYFTADEDLYGNELFKSDGTEQGTVNVADIKPGAFSSYPEALFATGSKLFFSVQDDTKGREPWVLPLSG